MALMGICRLGDLASGVCLGHGSPTGWVGPTTTASAGFTCDGIPVCTIGDVGTTSCGHTFTITTGSAVCTGVNGQYIARVGSQVLPAPGGSGSIGAGSTVGKTE